MRNALQALLSTLPGDAGAPLPAETRKMMEYVFRADFSDIRVHEGLAPLALGAVAFAHGSHLHFAPGCFRPGTREGRFLLGHELAHVLQQRGGRARGPGDALGVLEDPALEAEADHLGRLAAEGLRAPRLAPGGGAAPRHVIQPIKLELSHTLGSIHGLELLAILDETLDSALEYCQSPLKPTGSARLTSGATVPQYRIADGNAWFNTHGHLSDYYGRPAHQVWYLREGCQLLVGHSGLSVDVDHRGVVLVKGTTGGASYPQIAEGLQGILRESGLTDKALAELILGRMMGYEAGFTKRGDWNQFLDELIALVFGVEPSRNKLTFMTALMMFDLIIHEQRYGRGGSKPFGLVRAFMSEHDWDNKNPESGKDMNYGGKFPMATHGTGSGTLTNGHDELGAGRAQLIHAYMTAPGSAGTKQLLEELELRNQRHGITRREITLTIHWLEMVLDLKDTSNLRQRIAASFRKRLNDAYKNHWLSQYAGKVNPYSGSHSSPFLLAGTLFFWRDDGRFYHADPGCKTVPGQLRSSLREGSELQAVVSRKRPCSACWPLKRQSRKALKATYRCHNGHEHTHSTPARPAEMSFFSNCPERPCYWQASLIQLEEDASPFPVPTAAPLPELPEPPLLPEPMEEVASHHLQPLRSLIRARLNGDMETVLSMVSVRLSFEDQRLLKDKLIEFIASAADAIRTEGLKPFDYQKECFAKMVEYAESVCVLRRR